MGYVRFASQFRSVGPDGTTLYAGVGYTPEPLEVISNEAAGTTMNAGEAARFDGTRDNVTSAALQFVVPRFERVAAGAAVPSDIPQTEGFSVLRVSAATNKVWAGVAAKDIPGGKSGIVFPQGAIVCVKSLASASLTSNVFGNKVIGSSTAGAVDAITADAKGTATNIPGEGTVLGTLLRIAGTGTTATGSDTQIGIQVSVW